MSSVQTIILGNKLNHNESGVLLNKYSVYCKYCEIKNKSKIRQIKNHKRLMHLQ